MDHIISVSIPGKSFDTNSQQHATVVSFHDSFCDLARFLFPDGCPRLDVIGVWPPQKNRELVSESEAIQSIAKIQTFSQNNRLSLKESSAIILAIMKVIQLKKFSLFNMNGNAAMNRRHSKGNRLLFTLFRSLVPSTNKSDEDSDGLFPPFHDLLSLCSVVGTSNDGVKCEMLKLLYLVVQRRQKQKALSRLQTNRMRESKAFTSRNNLQSNVTDASNATIKQHEDVQFVTVFLRVVFPYAIQLSTCVNTVRLLLTLLSFGEELRREYAWIGPHQVAQLRAFSAKCQTRKLLMERNKQKQHKAVKSQTHISKPIKLMLNSAIIVLETLLQYLDYFNGRSDNNSMTTIYQMPVHVQQLLEFPDFGWEYEFMTFDSTKVTASSSCKKFVEEPDAINNISILLNFIEHATPHHRMVLVSTQRKDFDTCFCHTFVLHNNERLPYFIDWRENKAYLNCSLSDANRNSFLNHMDTYGKALCSPEWSDISSPSSLPSVLMERFLEQIAGFVLHTQVLPPFAEQLLKQNVLPFCDTRYDTTQALYSLRDIFPFIKPRSITALKSSGLLKEFSRILLYGRIQEQCTVILSLSTLIWRWGCFDWSELPESNQKTEIIAFLIKWCETLILRKIVLCGPIVPGLLQHTITDFIKTTTRVSDVCATPFETPTLLLSLDINRRHLPSFTK